MCLPNFDDIPQSTAEIKLLPVSENGRPPFWNYIFGFDFDVCIVLGLHLPAKFRSNRTIGSGVMTSYRFFKMAAIEWEMYFKFSDGICLRRWKSICLPNFHEISQSVAEIKLLPVSENGRPPFWNSISGFDFDVCIVIVMSFCICLPNFVVIRRWWAEL